MLIRPTLEDVIFAERSRSSGRRPGVGDGRRGGFRGVGGGSPPVVLLDPAVGGLFARASAKTTGFFDPLVLTGAHFMTTLANDQRCIDDWGDGQLWVYLEKNLTGRVIRTEEFDNVAWTKSLACAVTPNQIAGLFGPVTADKIASTGGVATCTRTSGYSATVLNPTFTVVMKRGNVNAGHVFINDGTTFAHKDVDLSDGYWHKVEVTFPGDPLIAPIYGFGVGISGSAPASGDFVYVAIADGRDRGASLNTGTPHSYLAAAGAAVSLAVEDLTYASSEYDPRLLTDDLYYIWQPAHGLDAGGLDPISGAKPDDCSHISMEGVGVVGANEILWANNDNAIRMRSTQGATSYSQTVSLAGLIARKDWILVQRFFAQKRISAYNLTQGIPIPTDSAGAATHVFQGGHARVGGRYNDASAPGAHGLDGRISPFYLGVHPLAP